MAKTTAKWIERTWGATDTVVASSLLYTSSVSVADAITSNSGSIVQLQTNVSSLCSTLSSQIGIINGAFLALSGGTVSGDILPGSDISYRLGSPVKTWSDIYVNGSSLNSQLSAIISKEANDISVVSAAISGAYSASAGASALAQNAAVSAGAALSLATAANASVLSLCGTVQSLSADVMTIIPVTAQFSALDASFIVLSTQVTTGLVQTNLNIGTVSSDLISLTNRVTNDEATTLGIANTLTGFIPLSGSSAITGDLIPASTSTVTLGSSAKLYKDVYVNTFGSVVSSLSALSATLQVGVAEFYVGVNKPYTTIQAAIDAAQVAGYGTTKEFGVAIDSGTYNESVTLIPGTYLHGIGGGDKTIITGPVTFSYNPSLSTDLHSVYLNRLTVSGSSSAALVELSGSYPLYMVMNGVYITNLTGPAVKNSNLDNGSIVTIKDSIISGVSAMLNTNPGTLDIEDGSLIIGATAIAASNGAISIRNAKISGSMLATTSAVTFTIIDSQINSSTTSISGNAALHKGLVTYTGTTSGYDASVVTSLLVDGAKNLFYSGVGTSLVAKNVESAVTELYINTATVSAQALSSQTAIGTLSALTTYIPSLTSQTLSSQSAITTLSSMTLTAQSAITSLSSLALSSQSAVTTLSSQALSSQSAITTLSTNTLNYSNWDSGYSTLSSNSGAWTSTFSTVCAWSGYWGAGPSGVYVQGPLSSTDNAIVRWNGISGRLIKDYTTPDGIPTIDDLGNISIRGTIDLASTNTTGGFISLASVPFLHAYGAANNTFLGQQAGNFTAGGPQRDVGIGYRCLLALNDGAENSIIGAYAGSSITDANNNSILGAYALSNNVTGNLNTAIGYQTLAGVMGSNNVAIGAYAGMYETESNKFYVNNQDRSSLTGDITGSLLYGTFSPQVSAQQLTLNGNFTVSGNTTLGGTYTPATSSDVGVPGSITWDSNYFYVCVSANMWKRTALSGW